MQNYLHLQNEGDGKSHSICYLPAVEIKDYNVMIDAKNFFNEPIIINLKTHENVRRIITSQTDDYTTGCLLDYSYFNNNYDCNRFK